MNRRMFCGGLLGLPAAVLAGKPIAAPAPAVPLPVMTYTIDSGISRAEMVKLMKQAHERTVREIADSARRGGAYRLHIRT